MIRETFMLRCTCRFLLKLFLCAAILPANRVLAQFGSNTNVAGMVEDSTQARIPDARVKLINVLTGSENDAVTSRGGIFVLPGVLPGEYILRIEREGFATAQVSGLVLNEGDLKNLIVQLKVGSVSETIEINALDITLDTADATVGTFIDRRFVGNLPLNGRSFQDLITLTPGVLTQNPQALGGRLGAGGLSVNGQHADSNYVLVDGVSANFGAAYLMGSTKIPSAGNVMGLTAIGTTQSLASVDTLQEFRALGSSYSAEYGTAPGGQFSLATRNSWQKSVHGSFYDYTRYSKLDSSDWFNRYYTYVQKTALVGDDLYIPFHQHDYGSTFGAPLALNSARITERTTSVSTSFEAVRVEQPTAELLQYVPSGSGIFQKCPSPLAPLINAFFFEGGSTCTSSSTSGTGALDGPILYPTIDTNNLPGWDYTGAIRVDKKLSPVLSAFIRISDSPSLARDQNLTAWTVNRGHAGTLTLGVTGKLAPNLQNEFRLGISRGASHLDTTLAYMSEQSIGLPGALAIPTTFASPRAVAYIHIPGIGESTVDVDHASSALHQWNVRDTFSLQTTNHALHFGFDERHIESTVNPAPLSVEADFLDQDSLINDSASAVSVTNTKSATPIFNQFAAFVQDDWKLPNSLMVSAGLRWELDPAPHGKDGADAYTLLGEVNAPATLQLAPRGTPLWKTDWFALAPRLGLAWTAHPSDRWTTVVRAGAGMFFNSANPQAAEAFAALGFSSTVHAENIPIPLDASMFAISSVPAAPYTKSLVYAFPQHLSLPYAAQWNVAVEQALGRGRALTASYVGAKGSRLLQEQRTNIEDANPNFGEIVHFPGGMSSNYQSMQLKLQGSVAPGVQALASYIWSHAVDFGSSDPAFSLVRGNSDLDVRQNLQAALSWNGRNPSGNLFHLHAHGGWGADARVIARTGYPVNLEGNLLSDPASGNRFFSGVDRIPGRPLYLYGSEFPGGRKFNGGPNTANSAFSLPALSEGGNAPRNQLRGFGMFQLNVAFHRDIRLSQNLTFRFGAEGFNVFNHPALGYIDPLLTNALFGQATLLLNQSFGSAGSLYESGGVRSLQFSARIHF